MNNPASKANTITFFPVPSAFALHKSYDTDALAPALFVCEPLQLGLALLRVRWPSETCPNFAA